MKSLVQCALGVGFIALLLASAGKGKIEPQHHEPAKPAVVAPPAEKIELGDTVTFKQDAFVCVDSKTYDEVTKLSVAKDEYGIKQLIAAKRVRPGYRSVPVKLLERGILQDRVRFGDGFDGWLMAGNLEKVDE